MGRKKKVVEEEPVAESLSIRPEQIIKYLTENGKLPDDFNPYGGYMPEYPRFLGDTPPTNTKFYVGINEDDEDVKPIYVSSPTPPELSLIDGFGIEQDEQYWERIEIPVGLKKLEDRALKSMLEIQDRNRQETVQGYRVYQTFWKMFEEEQANFSVEIEWIKKIWWHRIYGYWFFNDGEPVYCTGEYFDYLNFWYIKDSETWVEYREEDRKISLFSYYLRTTTETFTNINPETGRAVPEEDGHYKMTDVGSRTFYGDMKPKFRRCGETQWACHGIWLGCSTTLSAYGTIISMDGDNAEKHYYKKLIPSWNKYPMFLKPIWVGSKRPSTIYLQEPANVYHIEGLGSSIDYTESGGVSKNDGDSLSFCLSDEEGKCFGFDTEIIMANGDIRKVQDIVDGDKVMGNDGEPRLVSGCIKGYGNLYEISSKFGSFICNDNHILSLRTCQKNLKGGKLAGDIVNAPINEIITWHPQTIRNMKLYRAPIKYEYRKVPLDPYFLGIWLGDGNHGHADICNIDEEIISYVRDFARLWGGTVTTSSGKNHHIVFHSAFRGNPIRTVLKRMNLLYNKHIPSGYIKNTEDIRLQLLAGLIDTDGSRDPAPRKMVYDIVQKRKHLAEQICQLANSLGFWSRIENKVATMKRKDGSVYKCDVYRVKIYGDLHKIPVRVERKKHIEPTWWRNKNPNTSWFEITPIGQGDYYGFAVDGNHLFMLANQVVVHNSKTPISERWSVNKIAMSMGGGTSIRPNAYAWHPSTVEDIGEGAPEYLKMWELSNFYERIPIIGQTHSGLARIFIPAYKKLEGYIDRWGKSVIDNPTERQIKYSPRAKFALTRKGAKETLQAVLDSLLVKGTPEALELYRSRRRKFPMKSADCWLGSAGNVGFNLEIIDKRIEELNRLKSFGKMNYKVGYFYRENSDPDSCVLWKTDPDNPKFRISLDLPIELTNQRTRGDMFDNLKGVWRQAWSPIAGHRFTCGVDMFRNLTPVQAKQASKLGGSATNSRQSNGGIAILWEKDPEYPESGRCILSYNYRPQTQQEFMDDVLMAAQYFGAMIYPEQNVERFIEYMFDRGYIGYGLHDVDLTTGRFKSLPGRYTTNDTLQEIFREYKDYIESKGATEEHDDLLMQVKNIKGTEDATRNDLFVAFGMCLLGSRSRYREIIKNEDNSGVIDIDGLF